MPRTFEASHAETIVVFVGHHLLAEGFFFFFLNHCVSVNTDALHFHKLNYIYAQTKYYSCKKCFISHYDWAGVILMQHTWDKLVPCGQITSEIFGFAPRPPFPLFFTQFAMLLVSQIIPFSNNPCFEFVTIAHHCFFTSY